MTDEDRLEEIKYILESPGEVFFGNILSEGIVSQDVADAEPYLLWMVKRIDDLEQQKRLYREAMKKIWKLTETDAGTEEQVFIIADDILKQDKEEVKKTDDRTVDSPHSSWF